MPAGGVGCSPLPCLRRLFTHDDDDSGGGDGVMMTMVMMDGPHCPWVIYIAVLVLVMYSFTNVFQKQPATFIHSFITSIYIAPLQVGLLRGAPNPNTTK